MKIDNKLSVILGIIGGSLLITAGIIGSIGFYGTLIELVTPYVPADGLVFIEIALKVLNYLASLGGIAVIAGAILLGMDRERLGKIIIGIGMGTGLISFIIENISLYMQGVLTEEFMLILVQTPGWIGTVLALIAPFVTDKD